MTDLPLIMSASGPIPLTVDELRKKLIDKINTDYDPDLVFLPFSPLDALASTSIYALDDCQNSFLDLVNSITPYAANELVLNQLGALFGLTRSEFTRPSVFVRFSGTPGYVISKGFLVGDGTHQYKVADSGIVNNDGYAVIYCVATTDGNWAIPNDTVNQILTSVTSPIVLTCTNPVDGTQGTGQELLSNFRSRLMIAYNRTSNSTIEYGKDLIAQVNGGNLRLISIKQVSFATKIIVGGGDPYEVANAIFKAGFDVSRLIGSQHEERNLVVSIVNQPDTYKVRFIIPPAQTVKISAYWNTSSANFVSDAAISDAVSTALADYVNSLAIGQKINVLELNRAFQEAIKPIMDEQLLSKLYFNVYIDDVLQPVDTNTNVVSGDSESYFTTNSAYMTVGRG